MGFLRKKLMVALLAGMLGLGLAGTLQAAPTPFTVDPSVIDASFSSAFTATFMDFSYVALVDQTATAGTGSFTESGVGFFSAFKHPDLGTNVLGTGINSDYQLYFTFDATGTVAPDGSGGLDVVFTSFTASLFVDPFSVSGSVTTCDISGGGCAGSTGVGAPDDSVGVVGDADDVLVGTGSLIIGEAHINAGLANGDFDVVIFFEPVGGFFGGPVFVGLTVGDINGNNQSLTGFSAGSFTDGRIDGSGNAFFEPVAVPEPSTLLLLGSGLIGLAALVRRHSRKAA